MLVTVKYLGKRLPITLSMPWLKQHVTFANDRLGQMVGEDAAKLCTECPMDFQIVGAVVPPPVVEAIEDETLTEPKPTQTPAPKRKRKPNKKESDKWQR